MKVFAIYDYGPDGIDHLWHVAATSAFQALTVLEESKRESDPKWRIYCFDVMLLEGVTCESEEPHIIEETLCRVDR